MKKIKTTATIKSDGRLKINVPTPLRQGDVDVVLIIKQKRGKHASYDFSDISGKLSWKGDALKTQHALRSEW